MAPPGTILSYVMNYRTSIPPKLSSFSDISQIRANMSTFTSRQRTPLFIGAFLGAGALFIGLKWRAVLDRSEAAKKASTKENFSVATGRSGGGI
ncbi:hypothetical protein LSUE1_G004477 [Lachnellula suecica]|uniref:Uncharacterized protein n=1 Tax=Lachnellula suecica TaxID=602035 RepID=A0A8T9C1X5_9HELO|nr:hypothetical protein LSUE1_G004477 [Lachnellula suecica]